MTGWLTPRRRIREALEHREPDRVPFDLGSRSNAIELEAYDRLKDFLGLGTEAPTECFIRSHAVMDEEVLKRLRVDTRWVREVPETAWRTEGSSTVFVDAWDVPWIKGEGSFYFDLGECPYRGLDYTDILDILWPPLVKEAELDAMAEEAKSLWTGTDYSVSTDIIGAGIFERAWYLKGFEEFAVDLMTEPESCRRFLEKILRRQIEDYDRLLARMGQYIDTVWITDDVATQNSLIMSPDTYRDIVKPYQRELLSFIKSRGTEVVFHSCGMIEPLLEDFLEIGVTITHPVQPIEGAMDLKDLKNRYGKDLVFWGAGVDTDLLQSGTAEEVEDQVKERLDILAPGGGFVFSPTHCIQPKTPPENIVAMADTLFEYGRY
jgi:uroporphyrinogen decarboxylase